MRRNNPPVTPGQRFGRLVVEARLPATKLTPTTKKRPAQARCVCDCGTGYTVQENHLYIGRVTSCASCRRTLLPWGRRQHYVTKQVGICDRGSYRRLIQIYRGMMDRCHLPLSTNFKDYGARGIQVCDEWRGRPEVFITWAVQRPSHSDVRYSVDRIDNNGNYEPANCHFATMTEQLNNKRNNVIVEFRGEKMTATQFGRAHCPLFSSSRVIVWLRAHDHDTEGLLAWYRRCVAATPA